MQFVYSTISILKTYVAGVGLATALLFAAAPTSAFADGLTGSWSGSGSVVLPSGASEKARCKVSFRKDGGKSYGMNAVCASNSVRVVQTAMLEQVGENRYVGSFNNAEYNVTGTIQVTVKGGNLNASLRGGGGSASFSLSR